MIAKLKSAYHSFLTKRHYYRGEYVNLNLEVLYEKGTIEIYVDGYSYDETINPEILNFLEAVEVDDIYDSIILEKILSKIYYTRSFINFEINKDIFSGFRIGFEFQDFEEHYFSHIDTIENSVRKIFTPFFNNILMEENKLHYYYEVNSQDYETFKYVVYNRCLGQLNRCISVQSIKRLLGMAMLNNKVNN